METKLKKLSNPYLYVIIVLLGVMVWSCGGGPGRAEKQQLEEKKQETVQNINRMKNDIEDRIKYVETEISEATGEMQQDLQEARKELENQRDVLAAELEKIKAATLDSWNQVIAETSKRLGESRKKTNEVSKKVREMLDGE